MSKRNALIETPNVATLFRRLKLTWLSDEVDVIYTDDEDNTIAYYHTPDAFVASLSGKRGQFVLFPSDAAMTDRVAFMSRKTYFKGIYSALAGKAPPLWLKTFRKIAEECLPTDVTTWTVHMHRVDATTVDWPVPTPRFFESVHLTTYQVARKGQKGSEPMKLDIAQLYGMCGSELDMTYLEKGLKPLPMDARYDVFMILAHTDNRWVGVRTFKASVPDHKKPYVEGMYACGKGYGSLLQHHSEILLRTILAPRWANATSLPKFTLHSIRPSYAFWTRMGFESTGPWARDGTRPMAKRIMPDDGTEATPAKAKSKRPHVANRPASRSN